MYHVSDGSSCRTLHWTHTGCPKLRTVRIMVHILYIILIEILKTSIYNELSIT